MIAIILAGGFGTRMLDVIGDRPKALVELGGRTLLAQLLMRLRALPAIERIVLVSNGRYRSAFAAATAGRATGAAPAGDLLLLDDGAQAPAARLGALGDLAFALDRIAPPTAALVLGADNLFGFPLAPLLDAYRADGHARVGVRHNPDPVDRCRRGNLRMDASGRVQEFVEKPAQPIGEWSAAPLYLMPSATLARLPEYLRKGGDADAPGHFMAWLHRREPLYGWQLPGPLLDVGNPESLAEAQRRIALDPDAFAPTGDSRPQPGRI